MRPHQILDGTSLDELAAFIVDSEAFAEGKRQERRAREDAEQLAKWRRR